MNLTTPDQKVNFRHYKLTSKQAKFIKMLLSDSKLAAYKAYMVVYGTKSKASAATSATRLLNKDNVKRYQSALEAQGAAKVLDKFTIDQTRILKEESCIAFFDIGAMVDEDGFFIQNLKDLPEDVRRNISGLEITERVDPHDNLAKPYYKLKFNDKGASLRRLEQHLGMLNEKVEVGVHVTLQGLIAQIDGRKTGKPMIPHLGDKGDE